MRASGGSEDREKKRVIGNIVGQRIGRGLGGSDLVGIQGEKQGEGGAPYDGCMTMDGLAAGQPSGGAFLPGRDKGGEEKNRRLMDATDVVVLYRTSKERYKDLLVHLQSYCFLLLLR